MRRIAVALIVLAACGGEAAPTTVEASSTTAAPSTTTELPTTTTTQVTETTIDLGVSEETEAFCDSMVRLDALLSGLDPPDPAAVEVVASEVEATAPSALTAPVSTFLSAAEGAATAGDSGLLNTDEANLAAGEIEFYMEGECGFQSVGNISTFELYDSGGELVESTYSGFVDTEVPAGTYSISFVNVGLEAHELAILRVNDGVTGSAAEILALPPEEGGAKATFIRGMLVMPGNVESTFLAVEPGRYIFFCPIATGSTPENFDAIESGEMEGGPLHFTLGEFAELTVIE